MVQISRNVIPFDPLLALILDEFGQPKNNGVKKALLLTQVEYWCSKKLHNVNGHFWTYNSASEWKKQFPFWSENTIQQALKDLADRDGLLVRERLSKVKFDKTLWYRVDEEGLNALMAKARNYVEQNPGSSMAQSLGDALRKDCGTSTQDLGDEATEFDGWSHSACGMDGTNNDRPITEPSSYPSSEPSSYPSSDLTHNERERAIVEIVDYLNEKVGGHCKPTVKITRELIEALLDEGYAVDDFKKVINKKASEWLGTKFAKNLRPQTLFSEKYFDGYLNAPQEENVDDYLLRCAKGGDSVENPFENYVDIPPEDVASADTANEAQQAVEPTEEAPHVEPTPLHRACVENGVHADGEAEVDKIMKYYYSQYETKHGTELAPIRGGTLNTAVYNLQTKTDSNGKRVPISFEYYKPHVDRYIATHGKNEHSFSNFCEKKIKATSE